MHPHERRSPEHPLRRVKDYRPDGTRVRRWSSPERSLRLSYRKRPLTTLASTVVAILVPATLVVAGTQLGAPGSVAEAKRPAAVAIDWAWSDGSTDPRRLFNSSDYASFRDLPHLVLRVPKGGDALISLDFLQDGEWNAEWLTKANANGGATMPIDPFCEDESWCDGTYRYRVKMGSRITYLYLEYRDR